MYLSVANGDPRNSYPYHLPPDTTQPSAPRLTEQIPTQQPQGDAASNTAAQLQTLFQEAETLRGLYERIQTQQGASPSPEQRLLLNTIHQHHVATCDQHQQLSVQSQQIQPTVPVTNHSPANPDDASSRKRPASQLALPEQGNATRQRRTSDSTSDSGTDDTPLSEWGPARAIDIFMRENADTLQLDQFTVDAFAAIAPCGSSAQFNEAIPTLKAPGFASMLEILLAHQQPAAAGHLALTMLLYYCASGLVLPDCCVDAMSNALATLKSRPQDCKVQASTFAGLAKQATPIREAFADLLNRATVHRH